MSRRVMSLTTCATARRAVPALSSVVVLLALAIATTASPAFALDAPAPQATGALHALELGTTAPLPPPVSAAVKSSGPKIDPIQAGGGATISSHKVFNPKPLRFNNGYVQHHPRVFLTFWGEEWNQYPNARKKVREFYEWVGGSAYGGALTQYFDHTGFISNDSTLAGSYTDEREVHPKGVNGAGLRAEIHYSIEHQGWGGAGNYENQYVVLVPPGATIVEAEQGDCGYHEWEGVPWQIAWGVVFWDPECTPEGQEAWQGLQSTASHEWAEMVTDPIPQAEFVGWDNPGYGEIADLCQEHGESVEAASGIFVNQLFDDYLDTANVADCVKQDEHPVGFSVKIGEPSVSLHSANLTGEVNPAGWPGYYQFELQHGTEVAHLPATPGGVSEDAFTGVGVGQTATGLKGNTTYQVRLNATSLLTESLIFPGLVGNMSGGERSFTTPDWRPITTIEPATSVKAHSAVLHGTVNPQGTATSYQFEYGKTTAYGTKVPLTAENIGAGSTNVAVSQTIEGLSTGTTYHYRITATNAEGTSNSSDVEFRTPSKPVVTTEAASYTNTFEPQLNGTVDPERADTKYWFEYGLTTGYGSKIPLTGAGIGGGDSTVEVNQTLTGLQRNSTYHFRVSAENEVGLTKGLDRSLSTLPPCKGAEEKCAWSAQVAADPPPIQENELKSVSCVSSTMCMAVGRDLYKKTGFIERWDGSTWVLISGVANGVDIRQVSCASSTACVAVGVSASGGIQSWMIFNLGGGWQVQEVAPASPGGSEAKLVGISCTATACTSVGSYKSESTYKPLVERWNGSSWSLQSAPAPSEGTAQNAMLGVSCSSATSCVAVGEAAGKPTAESWNGSAWSLMTVPNPSGAKGAKLASVSCTSSTSCMAVGSSNEGVGTEKTLAERLTGSTWAIVSSPNPSEAKGFVNLVGVSCTASTACRAAGYYAPGVSGGLPTEIRTLSEAWNGTEWTIQATPNPSGETASALYSISCSASEACTAVGASAASVGAAASTLAERWNGSAWSLQIAVNPTSQVEDEFQSVSCGSTAMCVAVGKNFYKKNNFFDLWLGSEWKMLQSVEGEVRDVSCPLATACVAVGTSSSGGPQSWLILEKAGAFAVEPVSAPTPAGGTENVLRSVSCTASVCTAVGSYKSESVYRPLVERWTGTSWSLQSAPNPAEGSAQNAMLGVSCPSETSCIAAGEAGGKPVAERWNGTEWTLTAVPALPEGAKGGGFRSVACGSSSSCFAVGDSYESATGSEKPLAERWNGSAWSITLAPSPGDAKGFVNFTDVSCLSPNSCFAAGYYSSNVQSGTSLENRTLVETWRPSEWTLQSSVNAAGKAYNNLFGISCTSSIACTAVGSSSSGVAGPSALLVERYE